MPTKSIIPTLGAKSFSCPTCGALSHQTWYNLHGIQYEKDDAPSLVDANAPVQVMQNREAELEIRQNVAEYFRKRLTQLPFLENHEQSKRVTLSLENVWVSRCYSCNALAIWLWDRLIFPASNFVVEPNSDLDDDIKLDFREAARIVDVSPRGAAALLRLCIQKVCIQLGETGKHIDTDIASLVQKGLEPQIQQALDIVRVIGNEAVHPGQIDLKDDRGTAIRLFELVNLIADVTISRPKQVAELYGKLPETKLKAIEKRDGLKP